MGNIIRRIWCRIQETLYGYNSHSTIAGCDTGNSFDGKYSLQSSFLVKTSQETRRVPSLGITKDVVHLQSQREDVTLCIRMPNGNKFSLAVKNRDKIRVVKECISKIEHIPHDHQILKILGKPNVTLTDPRYLCEYNKWHHSELDMVLETYVGAFYISVWYQRGRRSRGPKIILKVNNFDTIQAIKDQIFMKLNIKQGQQQLTYQLLNSSCGSKRVRSTECGMSDNYMARERWLSNDTCTLGDYNVVLFCHMLNLIIRLRHVENDGAKHMHVYSAQLSDDLKSLYHKPNDYLLSVGYKTTINKL